jgi:hypothetical protein
MAKFPPKNSFAQIDALSKKQDNRKTGFSNQSNQDKLRGLLKTVDEHTLEVQEAPNLTPTEVKNPSSEQILEQLQQGECTLFFYKLTDGALRRMRCTLQNQSPVPSKYNKKGIVVVWDLDASQWRSFYPNRVFKLIRNEQTDIQ